MWQLLPSPVILSEESSLLPTDWRVEFALWTIALLHAASLLRAAEGVALPRARDGGRGWGAAAARACEEGVVLDAGGGARPHRDWFACLQAPTAGLTVAGSVVRHSARRTSNCASW